MRTVELKCAVGGRWALTHGAALADGRADVLIVTGVPDDIPNAEVIRLADKTLINLPIRAKEPAKVEFGRLGVGNIINLVIGRPPGSSKPTEERKYPRSMTLTLAQQAKLDALGKRDGLSASAWVARQIDRAKL